MDKESLLAHADELLEFLSAGLKGGADFVVAQSPLLLQEILAWEFYSSLIWIVSMLILGPIVYKTFAWRCFSEDWICETEGVSIILGVCSFAWVIPLLVNIVSLVKVTVAPRLFLVEYLANMLK